MKLFANMIFISCLPHPADTERHDPPILLWLCLSQILSYLVYMSINIHVPRLIALYVSYYEYIMYYYAAGQYNGVLYDVFY